MTISQSGIFNEIMQWFIILIPLHVLIIFATALPDVKTRERVFNGYADQKNKESATVSVMRIHPSNIRKNLCSGGIISSKHILTAAHCIIESNIYRSFHSNRLSVIIGSYKIKDEMAIVIDVDKMYVPREYKGEFMNSEAPSTPVGDIAILQLKKDIDFVTYPFIKKLVLPFEEISTSVDPLFSGYGNTNVEQIYDKNALKWIATQSQSGRRHRINIHIVTNEECATKNKRSVNDKHICGTAVNIYPKAKYGGLCKGDSGGPLRGAGNVVIGVLSMSRRDCDSITVPAIFTKVSSYNTFINNVLTNTYSPDMRVAQWFGGDCGEESFILYELKNEGSQIIPNTPDDRSNSEDYNDDSDNS